MNYFKYIVLYFVRKSKYNNMSVSKDKRYPNTWYCQFWYTDRNGEKQHAYKRGFKTKKAGQEWERLFKDSLKTTPDILFSTLAADYLDHKQRNCKPVTFRTCESRVRVWLVPYFGNKPIDSITPLDIKRWHEYLQDAKNERGESLSDSYISTLHRELSIMFNYAVKYYGLAKNPAAIEGNIKAKSRSLQFWTLEQFQRFIATFAPSDPFRVAFLVLYWTGCRVGECQALTIADIDLEGRTINIDKTFHIIHGKAVVHEPKTESSVRSVTINQSLADDLCEHISRIYEPGPESRLFTMTPSSYGKQLEKHAALADLPRIRVHDLRHSHASLLIDLGYTPTLIAARLGHENANMVLTVYGHLFPTRAVELAERLEKLY